MRALIEELEQEKERLEAEAVEAEQAATSQKTFYDTLVADLEAAQETAE